MEALPTWIYQQTLDFLESHLDCLHHTLYMVRRPSHEEEEEVINHPNHQEDKQDDSHHHSHPHHHHHLQVKEVTLPEERDSGQVTLDLMIIHNHHLEDMEEDPWEEEVVEEAEEEEDHLDHFNQVLLCHDHGENLEEIPLIQIEDHQVHPVLTHQQEYK